MPVCPDIRCPYAQTCGARVSRHSVPVCPDIRCPCVKIFGARVSRHLVPVLHDIRCPFWDDLQYPPQIRCHSLMSIVLSSETNLQCPSCYPRWREEWSRKTSSRYWGYSLRAPWLLLPKQRCGLPQRRETDAYGLCTL